MTKMTDDLRTAIVKGRDNAVKNSDSAIRAEHIVYGILVTENIVEQIVKERVEDFQMLLDDINELNKNIAIKDPSAIKNGNIPFDNVAQDLFEKAKKLNKESPELVTSEHFILAVLESELEIASILNDHSINKSFINKKLSTLSVSSYDDEYEPKSSKMPEKKSNSKTPFLDNFGRDLTALAHQGKLDPVVGREVEVERVGQILTRRKKNNPVLIGDPGVGKTAIAEGLAIRIAKKECPPKLQNKRLVALEMSNLVAGTKYRGEFEQRMKGLIEELREHPEVILFIDEMHTMVGAGNGSGSLDAANVFKPALARGEVQAIGATTLDEYREHIEKDGALERRFQKVTVNPTTIDETREILMNIKEKYEDYHNVAYTDEAIEEIVRLADRYITTREFPDKAIDILDEAGSRTQINIKKPENIRVIEKELDDLKKRKKEVVSSQKFEEAASIRDREERLKADLESTTKAWKEKLTVSKYVIDGDMIAEVVSLMTGIPVQKVSQDEAKKLLSLEKDLSGSVIGQEKAIKIVASAIKRNRTGIRRKNRPIGTFIFLGPTGVGKTELAKQLAKRVFGTEDALIRMDMNEYMEPHSVSKLIGAPPGYVGYDEGGQLTEKVRHKPYSVVLFDEAEKAHPKIYDVLMQLLDEGHITDGLGRTVNFKNTIIIFTSNVGVGTSIQFGAGIGFTTGNSTEEGRKREIILKELKRYFKPEFMNRIDDVIMFNNLDEETMKEIVDLQMADLIKRVKVESKHEISYGPGVDSYLQKNGYDKDMGARELQRAIQKLIEDPISEALLEHGMPDEAKIFVKMAEDSEQVKVEING